MEVNYETYIDFNSYKKSRGTKFMVSSFYGFDKIVREYANYPSYLPFTVGLEHGPSVRDEPTSTDLNAGFPVMFLHSLRLINKWKMLSSVPCYQMLSPFVTYRRSNKIVKMADAVGTIAFPLHSTQQVDCYYDIEQYIKELKGLPEDFHPVSICMYYANISNGMHKPFLDAGFKVYTAGHRLDPLFHERFYSILKRFKYSTSNHIGSYTYYSVELGMPFSLYGPKGTMYNNSNKSKEKGHYDPEDLYEPLKIGRRLFNGLNSEISTEQFDFVSKELGLDCRTSKRMMFTLLVSALLKYYASKIYFYVSDSISRMFNKNIKMPN